MGVPTLLHLGLATLEEVEGVGGFGVDVLHHREDVEDVLLCEGRLVTAVEVVILYQDLQGREQELRRGAYSNTHVASPRLCNLQTATMSLR